MPAPHVHAEHWRPGAQHSTPTHFSYMSTITFCTLILNLKPGRPCGAPTEPTKLCEPQVTGRTPCAASVVVHSISSGSGFCWQGQDEISQVLQLMQAAARGAYKQYTEGRKHLAGLLPQALAGCACRFCRRTGRLLQPLRGCARPAESTAPLQLLTDTPLPLLCSRGRRLMSIDAAGEGRCALGLHLDRTSSLCRLSWSTDFFSSGLLRRTQPGVRTSPAGAQAAFTAAPIPATQQAARRAPLHLALHLVNKALENAVLPAGLRRSELRRLHANMHVKYFSDVCCHADHAAAGKGLHACCRAARQPTGRPAQNAACSTPSGKNCDWQRYAIGCTSTLALTMAHSASS